jgi:hypothetical protein
MFSDRDLYEYDPGEKRLEAEDCSMMFSPDLDEEDAEDEFDCGHDWDMSCPPCSVCGGCPECGDCDCGIDDGDDEDWEDDEL